MADVQERQDFFINAGNQEDNDDLMDELNELEAEMAEDELDIEIGAGDVLGVEKNRAQQEAPARGRPQAQDNDEDLLAQMMA